MMVEGAVELVRRRRAETDAGRLALLVAIGTIPAIIVGGLGENWIDDHLGEPWQIAILMAVFALLLGYADRRPETREIESVQPRDALKVGLAQALALAPGVSRSGITITAGRFLGLSRDAAARFGFFLLVPVTAGAVAVKGLHVVKHGIPPGQTGPLILGVIASAISRVRRHLVAARLRAPPQLRRVRGLPARPGGGDPDPHRHGRARGDVLARPWAAPNDGHRGERPERRGTVIDELGRPWATQLITRWLPTPSMPAVRI